MIEKRSPVLVICLAVALTLSGCAGQQLNDQQERRVASEFEERMSEIDGYHATVTTTATVDNRTFETTADVWARTATGELRQEIIAPDERAGSRIVSNGSVMWSYNATANTATRTEIPETSGQTGLVPQVDRLLERYDVYSNGTVTLDGTDAQKLTLVPNESADAPLSGTITVWADAERMFPLKMRMETGEMRSTIRYENLSLDPEFDDGTFEFDPPEDAETRDLPTPDISQFQSYGSLADAVDRRLPDPELPNGFAFETGSVVGDNGTSTASVTYTDGERTLTVTVSGADGSIGGTGEEVAVGDRTGTYSEFGGSAALSWRCEDTTYSVAGQLEKRTLRDVAVAIGC